MSQRIQIRSGKVQSLVGMFSQPPENKRRKRKEEEQGRTLILMAHGFPGHKGAHNNLFGALETLLADKSHYTLRFDFRGCGESDGREEDFTLASASEDFQSVLTWAREQDFQNLLLVGEGIGATVAVMNADENTKALALLWPVLDTRHFAESQYRQEPDETAREAGYITYNNHRIGLAYIEELKKTNLKESLEAIMVPTLLMQGAQDKTVPISQLDMARAYMHARRVEITSFHDGTHGLTLPEHRKMVFYHLMQFLTRYA